MAYRSAPSAETRGKLATRRASLTLRDAMTEASRAAGDVAIADAINLLLAQRLAPGAIVALYAEKGSEVATGLIDAAARAAGFLVAYPRVVARAVALTFHEVAREQLAASRFGLREPSADIAPVALDEISAFVVPGLAFDRDGGRIGWGQGHYDATFAAAAPSALRVGLGYDCQLVDHVEREPHDVALHFIITEVATLAVA